MSRNWIGLVVGMVVDDYVAGKWSNGGEKDVSAQVIGMPPSIFRKAAGCVQCQRPNKTNVTASSFVLLETDVRSSHISLLVAQNERRGFHKRCLGSLARLSPIP